MFIIVLSSGKTGATIANILSKKKEHDVVVIDNDEASFGRLDEDFNGITILGNGMDEGVQRQAGAEKADVFLSFTDDQNTNIMASQVAKHIFDVPRIITKVEKANSTSSFYSEALNAVDTHAIIASELIDNIILESDSEDNI